MRRRRRIAGLACAAALALEAGCGARRGQPAVRIMPLGDSITQGSAEQGSYRHPLWRMLREAGFRVDFVGSQRAYALHRGPERGFDADHEGHAGWRSDQLAEHAEPWARESRPDIVLLHIGTNDVGAGQPSDVCQNITRIVTAFRESNPQVRFLVALIIPYQDPAAREAVARLNRKLGPCLAALDTPEAPVTAVDHFTGFDPARLTSDGMHPNAEGTREMARRWFAALAPALEAGAAGAAHP